MRQVVLPSGDSVIGGFCNGFKARKGIPWGLEVRNRHGQMLRKRLKHLVGALGNTVTPPNCEYHDNASCSNDPRTLLARA
jgi:hypothetical protein